MPQKRKPTLTPDEARALHREALVIDTPAAADRERRGVHAEDEAGDRGGDPAGRDRPRRVGAPDGVADGDGADDVGRRAAAVPRSLEPVRRHHRVRHVLGRAQVHGRLRARERADRPRVRDRRGARRCASRSCAPPTISSGSTGSGTHGILLDFQNTTPIGDDLDRIQHFYNLGVRMVQLTYNLRNLVGDGCTEANPSGLSYFGREVVRRLERDEDPRGRQPPAASRSAGTRSSSPRRR